MKKLLSMLLVFCMIVSIMATTAFASNYSEGFSSEAQTLSETYEDTEGNVVKLEYGMDGKNSFSIVYVNGVLTQKAYIYPEKDEIVYENYSVGAKENLESSKTAVVTTYKYSDFITNGIEKNPEDGLTNINTQKSWDPSGWVFLKYFAPSPILSGSKPCNLYFQNYDDNPDDNRYMARVITLSAGTPIAIAAGLVVGYIAGGVAIITVSFILQLLGASIVADIIYNYCYGEVCFSTQKILYAPIIEANNVFPDAYITKRWLVTADYLNNTYNVTLSNASYASNRGQTPENIAFNAQVATM